MKFFDFNFYKLNRQLYIIQIDQFNLIYSRIHALLSTVIIKSKITNILT